MAPKKKDYENMNTDRFYNAINTAAGEPKKRPEYTEEEAQEYKRAMKTTGRKGVKMSRINFAFTPENYDYVYTMSRVRGETMSEFLNLAVAEHMKNHYELYQKAIEFKNSL